LDHRKQKCVRWHDFSEKQWLNAKANTYGV
jgi:hypothetical protein